jgi:hypothetical protein
MNPETVRKAVAKCGGITKAAESLGISRHAAGRLLRQKASPAKKSLSDFRAEYDKDTIVPKRLKAALVALGSGGWEYEVPFARAAGVSLSDLSAYRDAFASNVVQLPGGRRAWAQAGTAAKMRSML